MRDFILRGHPAPRNLSVGGVVLALLVAGAACVQRGGAPAAGSAANAPSGEAAASTGSAVPSGGVSVLGSEGISAFQPAGATSKLELRTIDVTGQPFDKAIEAVVKEAGASPWEMQMSTPTKLAVQKDDV